MGYWKLVIGPPGGERMGARRRRSRWLRSIRSASTDRPVAVPNSVGQNSSSTAAARRF